MSENAKRAGREFGAALRALHEADLNPALVAKAVREAQREARRTRKSVPIDLPGPILKSDAP